MLLSFWSRAKTEPPHRTGTRQPNPSSPIRSSYIACRAGVYKTTSKIPPAQNLFEADGLIRFWSELERERARWSISSSATQLAPCTFYMKQSLVRRASAINIFSLHAHFARVYDTQARTHTRPGILAAVPSILCSLALRSGGVGVPANVW